MTRLDLLAWRLSLDLTQTQAAIKLGYSIHVYPKFEQGSRRITNRLVKLVEATNKRKSQ